MPKKISFVKLNANQIIPSLQHKAFGIKTLPLLSGEDFTFGDSRNLPLLINPKILRTESNGTFRWLSSNDQYVGRVRYTLEPGSITEMRPRLWLKYSVKNKEFLDTIEMLGIHDWNGSISWIFQCPNCLEKVLDLLIPALDADINIRALGCEKCVHMSSATILADRFIIEPAQVHRALGKDKGDTSNGHGVNK